MGVIREQTFFETAATLLPILLLTGVLTQGLRPPSSWQIAKNRRFALICVGVTLGAFAELSALDAVVSGQPTDFQRTVVPLAIAFAIAGVGAAIVAPWLTRLRHDHPQWRRHYRWVAVGFSILALTWILGTVRLYRSLFKLGDAECVLHRVIDWPGGPDSSIFNQAIVPRRLAVDQIALLRAQRAARADGVIVKNERSELRIRKLLLDADVNNWKLELAADPTSEC